MKTKRLDVFHNIELCDDLGQVIVDNHTFDILVAIEDNPSLDALSLQCGLRKISCQSRIQIVEQFIGHSILDENGMLSKDVLKLIEAYSKLDDKVPSTIEISLGKNTPHKWLEEEEKWLKKNKDKFSHVELAKKFGVSANAIRHKLKTL